MSGANHVNRTPETFIEFVAKFVERVIKRTSYLCATSRNIDMINGRERRKNLLNRCGVVGITSGIRVKCSLYPRFTNVPSQAGS
jgi:hypothetical protein